jgi:hypothetical protein
MRTSSHRPSAANGTDQPAALRRRPEGKCPDNHLGTERLLTHHTLTSLGKFHVVLVDKSLHLLSAQAWAANLVRQSMQIQGQASPHFSSLGDSSRSLLINTQEHSNSPSVPKRRPTIPTVHALSLSDITRCVRTCFWEQSRSKMRSIKQSIATRRSGSVTAPESPSHSYRTRHARTSTRYGYTVSCLLRPGKSGRPASASEALTGRGPGTRQIWTRRPSPRQRRAGGWSP